MAKYVPRVRKHKVKARLKAQGNKGTHTDNDTTLDSNKSEIVPSEQETRRKQLQDELRAQQPQEQISSKKRKRLDHYIDTKLKKEENLDLIKKIAAQTVDTSLFQSSKNLGRVKETQREILQRALKEHGHGIDVAQNEDILLDRRPETDFADLPENTPTENGVSSPPTQNSQSDIGAGLKRPLDQDDAGRPVIKRRKRRKTKAEPLTVAPDTLSSDSGEDSGESEWAGCSDHDEKSDVLAGNGITPRPDIGVDDQNDSSDSDPESSAEVEGAESASQEILEESDEDDSDGSEDTDSDTDTGDEEEDEDDSSDTAVEEEPKERVSAFKAWATQQRNTALGFTPSADTAPTYVTPANYTPSDPKQKPRSALPYVPELTKPSKPAASIVIPRSEQVQESRLELPVVQEEQKIMEAINANPTTVVWGATGSGKTTQIPQMLFESGYGSRIGDKLYTKHDMTRGMIGVTQPRRVAATSVAERVAFEMGSMGDKVGHQVRFETTVSSSTAIKFMTDGILLREVATDFVLSRYSVIVIDEAHERSVNTDVLIGLLSRIVGLRAEMAQEQPDKFYPLKLVIMSATLRLEDFTQNKTLFKDGPPPVVQAEGRQFPVVEHFAKRTRHDYVEEMFNKVKRGHKQLPHGGMLIFLTGKDEIVTLTRKLQQAAAMSATGYIPIDESKPFTRTDGHDDLEDLDNGVAIDLSDDESETESTTGPDEDREFIIEDLPQPDSTLKMHILPLHSQLPTYQQMKVFQPPPEGSRLIVLATNVAETSLTIPGIRYVFDCGRSKSKDFDPVSGVQCFKVGFISKASASQRAGRAGRTGPGHVYRLYSSAVYERDFEQNAVPDILRMPVENVALLIKSVDFPNVANFPFPTPPDRRALAKAEDLLKNLGAVDYAGKITENGRALASYPLSPRFARMLLLAHTQGLMAHATALVASLAVPELLLPPPQTSVQHVGTDGNDSDNEHDRRKSAAQIEAEFELKGQSAAFGRAQGMLSRWDDKADALKMLTAFALCSSSFTPSKADKFAARCEQYFIREKAMKEAIELRSQLVRIAKSQLATSETDLLALPVLKADDIAKLKYIVASGYIDQIAVRLDHLQDSSIVPGRKPKRAIDVAYRTLMPLEEQHHEMSAEEREASKNCYVHSSSLLARLSIAEMPTYVVYSHLSKAAVKVIEAGPSRQRTRIHPLCSVSARQLIALTDRTPLLEVGKPIGKIEQIARGDDGRERRSVWVGLSLKGKSDLSWPIGTRKEIQARTNGQWVTYRVIG